MFMQTGYEKSNNNNNDLSNSNLSRGRGLVDSDRYVELLDDLDLVSRFCMPICCRDSETRELALDVISKTVEGWLDGVGSPRHYTTGVRSRDRDRGLNQVTVAHLCACTTDSIGNNVASDPSGNNAVPKEYMELVTLHLPILLRLSMSCPFVNVREKCHHILEIVKVIFFMFYNCCFNNLFKILF